MNTQRRINTLHRPSTTPTERPPLLFVHGGYIHSGCWDVHFLPYFQERGYDCHAIDLSGHGASEGHESLDKFGIDDYAQDVRQTVDALGVKPVLIGHSMGAVVVQRYLENKGTAVGVAMLSPVPPTGTSTSGAQLNARQPTFLKEAARAMRRRYSEHTVRVMREVYFSPEADDEHLKDFLELIQAESTHAVTELMALAMSMPRRRPKVPALVMGGDQDAVFPSNMLHFTATSWNSETRLIRRAGHMLMLDPQWRDAADELDRWLEKIPSA